MELMYRADDELCKNIESFSERIAFYQRNVYDNVYVLSEDGSYCGFYNLKIDKVGGPLEKKIFFDGAPTYNEVEKFFSENIGIYRVPVLKNKRLVGEYYNYGSLGKSLSYEIEERSLSLACRIKPLVSEWSIGKRIVLVGDGERKETLASIFSESILHDESRDCPQLYLDTEFCGEFRKYVRDDAEKYISFSDIVVEIFLKKITSFFKKKEVAFFMACGVKKSFIRPFLNAKELLNTQKTLEEVLMDHSYVDKIYGDDVESKEFVIKHNYNLGSLSKIIFNGLCNILVDHYEDGFNIVDGKRVTVGSPITYKKTVHLFGPCIVQGLCVADSKTIPSIIQASLNGLNEKFRVVNHGLAYGRDLLNDLLSMMSTDYRRGDIVIWLNGFNEIEIEMARMLSIPMIDCISCFTKMHDWFCNVPFHCTLKANKVIADIIFKTIQNYLNVESDKENFNLLQDELPELNIGKNRIVDPYESDLYKRYLKKNKRNLPSGKKVGAVMISANPFTKGHLYLIEESLKQVDFLYIFLVVSNVCGFDYLARETMVKESLAEVDNICVLSGGETMTSEKYFPEYFNRNVQRTKVDTSLILEIFALQMAPLLDIKYRFFGEEKEDYVTNALNKAAQEVLPKYDIEVVEIPRKTDTLGVPISAKKVRTFFSEKNYLELAKLVPWATYKFLLEKNGDLTDANAALWQEFT